MLNVCGRDELDNFILNQISNGKITMLYFSAEWCGPCKNLKKYLESKNTIKNMNKLAVAVIDVDEELNSGLVKNYKISSLPTQVFIKVESSKIVQIEKIEGYNPTLLESIYGKILEESQNLKKIDI